MTFHVVFDRENTDSDTLSYFIQIAVCSHMVQEHLNNKANIITC